MRFTIGLVALAVLAACTAGSGTPAPSVSSESNQPSPSTACDPLNLRTPAGELVDLTGTWEGGDLVHHVRQNGGCVWWIAYSDWPGTELGEVETITFFGRLTPDFVVRGQIFPIVVGSQANVYGYPKGPGPLVFAVEFDATGNARLVRLGVLPGEGPLLTEYPIELRRTGPLPQAAAPPQQR